MLMQEHKHDDMVAITRYNHANKNINKSEIECEIERRKR